MRLLHTLIHSLPQPSWIGLTVLLIVRSRHSAVGVMLQHVLDKFSFTNCWRLKLLPEGYVTVLEVDFIP